MKPVLYFRERFADAVELAAAKKHFKLIFQRTHAKTGDLIIPRYSALPENKELCCDLLELGAMPINTYKQHCYVADLRNWYYDLVDLTPQTWFSLDQVPEQGPFVVKGATNSKKLWWDTHCFAVDKRAATEVFVRLGQDSMVGVQPIYVRQHVKLNVLTTGLHGLPVAEEYRFFVLDGEVVGSGFYWSSHVDDLDQVYDPINVPTSFIESIIQRVGNQIRFWVFDVARTASGDWILIELNDGQQAGLSEVDPEMLYSNLARILA